MPRETDVEIERFGTIRLMRSAGGGEYLTAPGALSIDVNDPHAIAAAGRGRTAAYKAMLTKAVDHARARWGRS